MKNLCLILLLISSASLAQSPHIWDSRVSLNRLANFATDLQRIHHETRSKENFDKYFIEALNSSPERVELIMSVLQGVEQISRESFELANKERAMDYESRGKDASKSYSTRRNLVTLVADPRLRHWSIRQSFHGNIFVLALSQLHTLNGPQFKLFADGFIKSLIKTNDELKLLNQSLNSGLIQDHIGQAREYSKEEALSAERMKERPQRIEAQASANYDKYEAANISFAAELLSSIFTGPITSTNMQNPNAARVLPIQFHRIAYLVQRALRETSAYNEAMVLKIREVAKMYVDMTFEDDSPEMKSAFALSFKSKISLTGLNNILNLPISCRALTNKSISSELKNN
jgi:hypothetical protein